VHYLVTGGCGFIGTHLVKRLLADGHKVTIMDDLSNSNQKNVPAEAKVIIQDVTSEGAYDSILKEVDGVFHLAAVVSVIKSTQAWRRSHEITQGGTVALFDALARMRRNIPVVYPSSAAVYGDSPIVPFVETSLPLPISAYGVDKRACELHARVGHRVHGIPSVGLRFFNVYGLGQNPDSPYAGVISLFIKHMLAGEPVTIFGDGEQTRDYIEISDVIRSMTTAMQKLENNDVSLGVYNICTGTPTTINQLAAKLLKLTGSKSSIVYSQQRSDDIRFSQGDSTLARAELGFATEVVLGDGLINMLKYK